MSYRVLLIFPLILAGCDDDTGAPAAADMAMMAPTTLGTPPTLAMPCSDAVADVYNLPASLATFDETHRGDVFHCAAGESLTAAKVNAEATNYGYTGPALPSGFWSFRIAYRAKRPAPDATPATLVEGDITATVLVPDHLRANAPLVVFAHGSVGLAARCAPSRYDLSTTVASTINTQEDFPANLYELAGYGYPVIVPDYAGFSYDQAPGYFSAPDEAYALLDATRAATNLLPTTLVPADPKVVIIGHSQGGHAAMAAQALVNQPGFGMKGTLVGVTAFAPFYFSMAAWEAVITSGAAALDYNTTNAGPNLLFGLDYMYSVGELYDGAGHGLDNVVAAKRDAAKAAMYSTNAGAKCRDYASLTALGTYGTDYMDMTFGDTVGNCGLYGPNTTQKFCDQGDAPKWVARWRKDRPPLDPAGAKTLIWFGGMDKFVPPGFGQCSLDTIATDKATAVTQICFDSGAGHQEIVRRQGDYVNQWIAHQADATQPDPGTCPGFPSGDMGVACTVPPANL